MSPDRSTLAKSRPIVPSGVLAMAMFIATEAMFFAGLISAFVVLRAQAPDWPPMDQPRLPVGITGINTVILLASGWTMQRALRALREGGDAVIRWLGATALLGAIFLVIQGSEWVRLVHFGLTTSSSLYGATFYTLIGAHGLHVLAALVALLVALRLAIRRRDRAGGAEWLMPYRMFWHFVVAVWPILYVLVYLT
jgi:heme/copper-type cytochrome/quinol oxidase subunit 3